MEEYENIVGIRRHTICHDYVTKCTSTIMHSCTPYTTTTFSYRIDEQLCNARAHDSIHEVFYLEVRLIERPRFQATSIS